jgi:hypothetical protein
MLLSLRYKRLIVPYIVKMVSAGSSGKLDISTHQAKRRHVPENCKLDHEARILSSFTALSC